MNRNQALRVHVGDSVEPDPLWNKSERERKLPPSVKVLEIQNAAGSQTGVLWRVRFLTGGEAWLDAGWFLRKV